MAVQTQRGGVMTKRGPGRRSPVPDAIIMDRLLTGGSNTQIGKDLGVSRQYVAKVRERMQNSQELITNANELKPIIRLEITQEDTLNDLSEQLKEYTDQYKAALDRKDERSAYAWSQNRIKLIDMMAKITGLYNPRPIEQQATDSAITINFELVD